MVNLASLDVGRFYGVGPVQEIRVWVGWSELRLVHQSLCVETSAFRPTFRVAVLVVDVFKVLKYIG